MGCKQSNRSPENDQFLKSVQEYQPGNCTKSNSHNQQFKLICIDSEQCSDNKKLYEILCQICVSENNHNTKQPHKTEDYKKFLNIQATQLIERIENEKEQYIDDLQSLHTKFIKLKHKENKKYAEQIKSYQENLQKTSLKNQYLIEKQLFQQIIQSQNNPQLVKNNLLQIQDIEQKIDKGARDNKIDLYIQKMDKLHQSFLTQELQISQLQEINKQHVKSLKTTLKFQKSSLWFSDLLISSDNSSDFQGTKQKEQVVISKDTLTKGVHSASLIIQEIGSKSCHLMFGIYDCQTNIIQHMQCIFCNNNFQMHTTIIDPIDWKIEQGHIFNIYLNFELKQFEITEESGNWKATLPKNFEYDNRALKICLYWYNSDASIKFIY